MKNENSAGVLNPPVKLGPQEPTSIDEAFVAARADVAHLERVRNLVTLFDALRAALPDAAINTLGLHCYDGVIVKTLQQWAERNALDCKREALTIEGKYTWDVHRCGGVTVHDARSRRPHVVEHVDVDQTLTSTTFDSTWSPAQAVAS